MTPRPEIYNPPYEQRMVIIAARAKAFLSVCKLEL